MGFRCCIEACENNSYRTRFTKRNIKFYSFPKNQDLRAKWIAVCRLSDDWSPDNTSSVCSVHFLPSDFKRDLKAELLHLTPKQLLQPEAVPSINLSKLQNPVTDFSLTKKPAPLKCECENEELQICDQKVTSSDENKENVDNSQNGDHIVSPNCNQTENLAEENGKENAVNHSAERTSSPTLNKNVFKLEELCRLCGSYSDRMKPIFGNTELNYSRIIHDYFPYIKVKENDILPMVMCFQCESILTLWHKFNQTCNDVNRRYQQILEKLINTSADLKPVKVKMDDFEVHIKEEIFINIEDSTDFDNKEIEVVELGPDIVEENVDDLPLDKEDLKTGYLNEVPEENRNSPVFVDVATMDEEKPMANNSVQTTSRPKKRRKRFPPANMRRMCHVCGKTFTYPESLRRHLKTVHSDEKPFKCPSCSSSFNRNHNLTIHIKVVHQNQRIYPRRHIPRLCDYCGKVLLSARSLEEHISSIHTRKPLYECVQCHATFFRKLSFDKHKSRNDCLRDTKINAIKEEEALKCCEICGLEFKKEHFYLKHKLKHENLFVCSFCDSKFEDQNTFREHVDSIHPEVRPFECKICHKKFRTKPLLNCHMVLHNGEKKYTCPKCPLKFLKKKYLTTHILTHTGERPYVCSICHKGFKQSGDMRKHKAGHIRSIKSVPQV